MAAKGSARQFSAADFRAAIRKVFTLEGAAAELGTSLATLKRRLQDNGGENELAVAWTEERGRKADAAEAAIWRAALGDLDFKKMTGEKLPATAEEWKAVRAPNPISQIWLSKNHLGWKDKPDIDLGDLDENELERLAIEILERYSGKTLPKTVRERAKQLADEDDLER